MLQIIVWKCIHDYYHSLEILQSINWNLYFLKRVSLSGGHILNKISLSYISNTTMQDFYRYKHIDYLAYIEGFIFINKATAGLDNLQKTTAACYH